MINMYWVRYGISDTENMKQNKKSRPPEENIIYPFGAVINEIFGSSVFMTRTGNDRMIFECLALVMEAATEIC